MKSWYHRGYFCPREIDHDRAYKDLRKSTRKQYHWLCSNSYLVKRSPTRRYCHWTYAQIAKATGWSHRQTQRNMTQLIEAGLVRRWYAGDSGSKTTKGCPRPPRYEIPASIGMVSWWRRGEYKQERSVPREEKKRGQERTF